MGRSIRTTFTGKRHYFGEDALTEKHWPRTGPNGECEGLIREMETIQPEDYGIEIINCTPGFSDDVFSDDGSG